MSGLKGADVAGTPDGPVINGPFDPPQQHFEIGPAGPTGVLVPGRRPSESWIPVPAARKGRDAGAQQVALDFDVTGERREPNPLINDIRREVERWRLDYRWVTPIRSGSGCGGPVGAASVTWPPTWR